MIIRVNRRKCQRNISNVCKAKTQKVAAKVYGEQGRWEKKLAKPLPAQKKTKLSRKNNKVAQVKLLKIINVRWLIDDSEPVLRPKKT